MLHAHRFAGLDIMRNPLGDIAATENDEPTQLSLDGQQSVVFRDAL